MARNGSGTYSLPAGNPVVTGTVISSTVQNNTMNDVATALTQSIAYDGQTVPVANLPMGTYRHTGVGAGVALTDYARYDQVQNSAAEKLTSVAGTNTVTATATPTPAAYAVGQVFNLVPAATNTGATTLNVSSLGAGAVQLNGAALIGGEFKIGVPVSVYVSAATPVFEIVGNGSFLPKSGGALTGLLTFKKGADIASASTVDLTAASGNTVHITGTTGISALTMTAGQVMDVIFDGALTLTYHATNNNLPGAANITTAAGDRARYFYDGTTVYCLDYIKKDGQAVMALGLGQTFTDVSASRAAGVTYTNSTGKPIFVVLSAYPSVNAAVYLSVNGSSNQQVRNDGLLAGVPQPFVVIVAPGDTYALTSSAGTLTIAKWWEYR